MRLDSHHSFSERYPLEHLALILERNRFEGSILIGHPSGNLPDFVKGIVVPGDVNPSLLDQYQQDPRFCGVLCRVGTEIPVGLGELERRGIPIDLTGGLALVAQIVERYPDLQIAIDHLGNPAAPTDEWARDLACAAESPRVYCKLSCLTRLTPSARVYVQHALAVFGPSRLMFGSDWPFGLPEATWKASLATFTQAIGAKPVEVREQLLGVTAQRFYGISPDEEPER